MPSLKGLGSAESERDKEGRPVEGATGGPVRRQDVPAKSGSLVSQHSSGSLPVAGSQLEAAAGSLDLGLLPPREMQVSMGFASCTAKTSTQLFTVSSILRLG